MPVDPYLAEIMPFAGNFAVRGWAYCDGQLLPISQNTALFSLIGTIYGGDGRTTFALPDLRGRSIVHPGNGPGLDSIRLGERGGAQTHTLNIGEMPSHNHLIAGAPAVQVTTTSEDGEDSVPNGNFLGKSVVSGVSASVDLYASDASSGTGLLSGVAASAGTLSAAINGGGQSFGIRSPYLGINMEIALVGVFPSRS
jgi:microcystin-dependent protein